MNAGLPVDRVSPARTAEPADPDAGSASAERARLAALAAEFEAMLLTQMLRDMRKAGSWSEEGDTGTTFGAEALFETFDVELARHLASVQGFGLAREMVSAWTARHGGPAAVPPAVPPAIHTLPSASIDAAAFVGPLADVHAASLPADAVDPTLTLPSGTVTSPFGWRADPFSGLGRFHAGVDIRAAYGEDVAAAGPGRVTFSGEQGGYGVTVVLDHGNGVQTRYAHLSDTLVTAGDIVRAGQVLGRIGQSGRATGPHLHFEVTTGGRRVDPAELDSVQAGLNPGRILADLTHQSTPSDDRTGQEQDDDREDRPESAAR